MFTDGIQPLLKLAAIRPRNGVITFGFVGGRDRISTTTQNHIRYMFKNMIEPFINVRFVETQGEGDINFRLHDESHYAYASNHDVFLSRKHDNASTDGGFQSGFGSHGFETLLHETIHALGLSHPGNYNGNGHGGAGPFLVYTADNNTNSVMTYNSAGESAITPMPYDIAALQYLYGASSLNAGSTYYQFSSVHSFSDGTRTWGNTRDVSKLTLWDQGGTDTLDFSQLKYEASGYILDARAGGILTTARAFDGAVYKPLDAANRYTTLQKTSAFGTRLTYNTQVEKVVGSQSSDVIFAGERTQQIIGLGGNDRIQGSNRDDLIFGGTGNDVIVGGAGNDQLVGGDSGFFDSDLRGNDRLLGGAGKDRLWGEGGNDQLFGGQHDDLLFGGSGNDQLAGTDSFVSNERDQLFGGAGRDWFILGSSQGSFYQGRGYAVIKDWQAGLDKILLGRTTGRYSTKVQSLSGGTALDTGIYHNNDLVGVIEDSTNVSASRGDFAFA